jgi:hypothetical protein
MLMCVAAQRLDRHDAAKSLPVGWVMRARHPGGLGAQ